MRAPEGLSRFEVSIVLFPILTVFAVTSLSPWATRVSSEGCMRRELAIEFSRVTEAAALAGYKWLGRGDKDRADAAAVEAMRVFLPPLVFLTEVSFADADAGSSARLRTAAHGLPPVEFSAIDPRKSVFQLIHDKT